MPILARLHTTQEAADRRASPRHQLSLGSTVAGEPVTIHDLSGTGMLIETAAGLHPFDSLEISLPETGTTAAVVVWHSGRYFGCEFKEPLFQAAVSAARLRSPPAVPVQVVQPALPLEGDSASELSDRPEAAAWVDEEKAPVSVRLRVILGSALVLWTLIIWTIATLSK